MVKLRKKNKIKEPQYKQLLHKCYEVYQDDIEFKTEQTKTTEKVENALI